MSSFAQLEADLFLAERAFKRIPSDENKLALDKVKEAIESFGSELNAPAPKAAALEKKAPTTPKATTPKAPKAQKTTAATPEANTTDESKKK